jgi:sec-independent protein translocase protein TatC
VNQQTQHEEEEENLPEMTFWDHLEALRWMLIRCFIAIGILVIGSFAFIPWLFKHVIMAPCRTDFFLYRFLAKISSWIPLAPDDFDKPFNVNIINIRLPSQFFLQVSLSFWLALLVAFPYIVFEIWRFVCPALYTNERRGTERAFIFGTVMFFLGCFVGYSLVFPLTLRFLYTYQISPDITNQLSLDSYMSNFLMLVFMMGIIFELPLLSALLSKLGLLNRSFFKKYRKHAIVVLLLVAAIITPSSDPFTLTAVFLPIYILWELSAFLVKPAPKEEDS